MARILPETSKASRGRTQAVEVLNGNESDSGRSRRASDKHANARRALDWGTRPSDVLLLPHSPMSLADVLTHPAGRFDLTPVPPSSSSATDELARENNLASSTESSTPVVSLQQRRRQRHPRERVKLLTRHSEDELLDRCRQLLVENALVKGRGVRQLFLATGFINWLDPAGNGQRGRAPLLFYPVLLVRRPEEQSYELRLDGSDPLGNEHLALRLLETHGIVLPPMAPAAPLVDYLAFVASLVAPVDTLDVEFDIALGNAELPPRTSTDEPVYLPDFPPLFDREIASTVTGTLALDQLHAVLHLLPDYASIAPPIPETPTDGKTQQGDVAIAQLREYAARLAAEGLDNIEFRHLGALPESLDRWRSAVAIGLATTTVRTLVGEGTIGARHLVRLAGIIELIDKAPSEIESFAHPDLCFHATNGVLRRARHQARLIEDELAALQDWFVLDKVPAKRQLLNLIEELGGSVGVEPDIVDADYFNARRQFMEFSIEKPANLTPEHRRLLGQLAKVLRFRELFVNNTEYRSALGPGYRGLRTDWGTLESMSDYATELADVLESETLAASALGSWSVFRRAFIAELEELQQAADATRRLLRIGGSRWQSRPIGELLSHTVELSDRLNDWSSSYGSVDAHANRTPASVLARFSGREREDLLTEVRVAETQELIDALVDEDQLKRNAVSASLAWLRDASDIATRNRLGVEVILARLRAS